VKAKYPNKIYFKFWRFLELELSGKDAIKIGKPYLFILLTVLSTSFLLLCLVEINAFHRLISLLAR
jgi:hypothetical protein